MDGSKQLQKALSMQFSWVKIIFSEPNLYSSRERFQAYLFAAMHLCFVLTLFGHSLWTILSQVLTFMLQIGAFGVAMIAYATMEEYADKMSNAMELEQSQNPLMVASISIRCFSLFHAFLNHAYFLIFFGLVEVLYNIKVSRQRSLFIDATTVWKEVKVLRQDRGLRLGYNGVMVLIAILNMLYLFCSEKH